LPPDDRVEILRERLGGTNLVPIAPPHLQQFDVGGVAVQVGYTTVEQIEAELEAALERLEETSARRTRRCCRACSRVCPCTGRSWSSAGAGGWLSIRMRCEWPRWSTIGASFRSGSSPSRGRCATLSSGGLLGKLVVETGEFVAKFALAPPELADRLESLFRLSPAEAADELGKLVVETRELGARELPELELPLWRPPGTRAQAWSV
jgi:hypothetical protein